jgi:hypothetical protein
MTLLPSCLEVSEAAARGEPLSLRLRAHLAVCAGCRRFRRQLALIAAALRERAFPQPGAAQVDALRRAVLARLRP